MGRPLPFLWTPSPLPTRCGADPSFSGAVIVTSEPATGERPNRSVGKRCFPPSLAIGDVVWTCLESNIDAVDTCLALGAASASSSGRTYAFAVCIDSIPAQFRLSVRARSRVLIVQRPRSCAAGEENSNAPTAGTESKATKKTPFARSIVLNPVRLKPITPERTTGDDF